MWGLESFYRVHLNQHFNATILVLLEHVFGLLLTLPLLFFALPKMKRVPKSAWIFLILSGCLGSAVGTTFFTMALKEMNASVANLLLKLQPVFCVLSARLVLKEKWGKGFLPWAFFALVMGVSIALVGEQINLSGLSFNKGLLYISITALAWGFSTVAGRGAMMHIPAGVAVLEDGRYVMKELEGEAPFNIHKEFYNVSRESIEEVKLF
jgi:drug/metabolite transporter (DMT)-like permease